MENFIYRKIEDKIIQFFENEPKKALLVTGARQVGKTFIIRKCIKECFSSAVEINFIRDESAKAIFQNFKDTKDILLRLSAIAGDEMIPGETIIFLDEVQECKEIVTAIKFLVEEGSYRYVMSGSLLGVELKDIRSVPVGYMDIFDMYPLDFEEFCLANHVSGSVLQNLKECFEERKPVDQVIHEKMMEMFKLYLIVGGMPEAAAKYLSTNNLRKVQGEQQAIIRLYRQDIAKYDPNEKLYLDEIFELIPSELNNHNKRFILKNLNENFKLSRYENSFLWLRDAGVALPVYCANEPLMPLRLSKSTNLFKLFLADTGLLAAMYADGIQMKILAGELNMNYGAIYENVVAQELKCHGFDLYYYNSHKNGELDFVVEYQSKILPIEVKSGKDYQRHNALNNCLDNPRYGIQDGFVFCNENVCQKGKVTYYPVYMITFLEKGQDTEDFIYKPDFSVLM
ncbi:MAG: ATP-binding protein [Suilimivivens sp.]